MAKTNIFDANWVDMVFEDRNHDYGAFVLRKKQSQNTIIAIVLAVAFCSLIISAPVIINYIKGFVPAPKPDFVVHEVATLDEPDPVDEKEPPPDVPPPPPLKSTIQYTPPVIVEDKDVPDDAKPPIQDDLDTARVSTQTQEGSDNGIDESLLVDNPGNGVVQENNEVFDLAAIEQNPEFPGGESALLEYIAKNTVYPPIALENGTVGTVKVQFVVEKDGSVSNVKVVGSKTYGDGLEEEGVRVVKTLPRFTPGKQNGNSVRVRMNVPIKFRLK